MDLEKRVATALETLEKVVFSGICLLRHPEVTFPLSFQRLAFRFVLLPVVFLAFPTAVHGDLAPCALLQPAILHLLVMAIAAPARPRETPVAHLTHDAQHGVVQSLHLLEIVLSLRELFGVDMTSAVQRLLRIRSLL
eukprot:2761125-Rhodomonas_salina.1